MNMSATISPRELVSKKDRGEPIQLIDVRTPAEFEELRSPFATNIPLHTVKKRLANGASRESNEGPLYLICRSGVRATRAMRTLRKSGLENVLVVRGGTDAWLAEGLPMVRGKKAFSIERQVRIAAGAIAATGAALAISVNPLFAGIPLFVGTGLFFAGITDSCGMARILTRMPWNHIVTGGKTCQG